MVWLGLIGVLAAAFVILTFNRLTRLRQLGDNAWADIDVQLKRRHDLIPSVVAVVKGHAGYERATLEALVAARGRAVEAVSAGPAVRFREEDSVAGGVRNLLAIAEAYPDLRAAASFAGLQRTLTEVEDHLQNARRYYNAVVRDFNTAIAQFPANLIATPMAFRPREFFGIDDDAERAVPRVEAGGRS
jgi:LemA protein